MNVIPRFRGLAETVIMHDINFVAEHGVKFEYSCDPEADGWINFARKVSSMC